MVKIKFVLLLTTFTFQAQGEQGPAGSDITADIHLGTDNE